MNHRNLRHPHIIGFKKAILSTHALAIVMEFACGGDIFEAVSNRSKLEENDARVIFQQARDHVIKSTGAVPACAQLHLAAPS